MWFRKNYYRGVNLLVLIFFLWRSFSIIIDFLNIQYISLIRCILCDTDNIWSYHWTLHRFEIYCVGFNGVFVFVSLTSWENLSISMNQRWTDWDSFVYNICYSFIQICWWTTNTPCKTSMLYTCITFQKQKHFFSVNKVIWCFNVNRSLII